MSSFPVEGAEFVIVGHLFFRKKFSKLQQRFITNRILKVFQRDKFQCRVLHFTLKIFILLFVLNSDDGLKHSAALATTYPSGHLQDIFSRTPMTNFCASDLNSLPLRSFSIHKILDIYRLTFSQAKPWCILDNLRRFFHWEH